MSLQAYNLSLASQLAKTKQGLVSFENNVPSQTVKMESILEYLLHQKLSVKHTQIH
jgi:hypothetical protein